MELALSLSPRNFSPPLQITSLVTSSGASIGVVRDDLLIGGTKQRACAPFLETLLSQGHEHFVYASPFAGFAQVALAYVSSELGTRCTLICEKDQRFPTKFQKHPFTQLAESFGARIVLVNDLDEAEAFAQRLSDQGLMKIPLGFNCPEFKTELAREVERAWIQIRSMRPGIKRLWLPIGSGTLLSTFKEVIPSRIQLMGVNVRVLSDEDHRIEALRRDPAVKFFQCPLRFHEEAQNLPAIPSNLFYDAKIWALLNEHGQEGDLWWNVAR